MSIKLELDAESIKKAITTHISNQGFDLAGKTVEVSLVNGRGGNGNRASVVISDDIPIEIPTTTPNVSVTAPRPSFDAPEATKALPDVAVEETVEIEQEEVIVPDVDPILAAAENSADPFADEADIGDGGLFPSVNPSEVETPKSLF